MLQFFNGRRLRYEFHALINERWQLVGVTDDERDMLSHAFDAHDLRDLEARVQRRALAILGQPGVSGIKVFRERLRKDGQGGSEEIFRQENPPVSKQEPRFKDYQGEAPLCFTIGDLLTRPATRVIGTMLRPFLDQLCISPLELLTIEGTSRVVRRADDVVSSVIMRVAQIQSRQPGGDARRRAAVLDSLVTDLRAQIKAAELCQISLQSAHEIDGFIEGLSGKYAPEEFRFFAFRSICLLLRDARSPGAKLDKIIEFGKAASTVETYKIIDGMLADLIDHPLAIQDLLGPQPDLRHAIETLVQLAHGEISATHVPLVAMNSLFKKAPLPESLNAIYERVLQSLSAKSPLTHGDIGTEWKAVEDLANKLLPRLPPNLQLLGACALDKRQERLQEASFALVEND